jgi:hypothetical protein
VDFLGILACAELLVEGELYTWNPSTCSYHHANGNQFALFTLDDPPPPIPLTDPNVVMHYEITSGPTLLDYGRVI